MKKTPQAQGLITPTPKHQSVPSLYTPAIPSTQTTPTNRSIPRRRPSPQLLPLIKAPPHYQQSIINNPLSTIHCQQLIVNYPLKTIHCQLSIVSPLEYTFMPHYLFKALMMPFTPSFKFSICTNTGPIWFCAPRVFSFC